MLNQVFNSSFLVWAAEETTSTTTRKLQYDLPKTFEQWLLFVVVATLLCAYIVWMYLRDTRSMHWFWRGWMMLLRLAVVAGLAVIFFNPHIRTQENQYRPSRVAILLDKSLSTRFAAEDLNAVAATPGAERPTRAQAIATLLGDRDLLDKLSETHLVKFFLFGKKL
jgi:glucan phosphoethanolaminetransferase (alkaline phosphatase superfamily)